MEVSIILGLFMLGAILGSFYNVVASRITKGESILFPPSHCPNCNHRLKPWELIPIFSFIIQGGKCTNCKIKMSWFYPISEIVCGLLFVFSYLSFGISWDLLICLTYVSMLIIIILSDIYYMIIEDCVLIIFGIFLIIEILFIHGYSSLLASLLSGFIAFVMMFLVKKLGDFLFKKESLGGGDIKLMFIVGMMISWQMSFINLFIASLLALPTSIIILKKKKSHELPFGPFLALASLIIYFLHVDFNMIIELLRWY